MGAIPEQQVAKGRVWPRGTHIAVSRGFKLSDIVGKKLMEFDVKLFEHHGIYFGYRKVIHHQGWDDTLVRKRPIAKTSLDEFAKGGSVFVVEHEEQRPWKEILASADLALRTPDDWAYSLPNRNCEHFATWCATGRLQSMQVQKARVTLIGPVGDWIYSYFAG